MPKSHQQGGKAAGKVPARSWDQHTMAKPGKRGKKTRLKVQPPLTLKGWQQIAEFLGQPTSVAQRWAKTGMPITRQGRSVVATPEELNKWLGRESGEPVHVATAEADLAAELKRGLAYVRSGKRQSRPGKRVPI
jgi:hypothetical protein